MPTHGADVRSVGDASTHADHLATRQERGDERAVLCVVMRKNRGTWTALGLTSYYLIANLLGGEREGEGEWK